jgi:hypothetical protein
MTPLLSPERQAVRSALYDILLAHNGTKDWKLTTILWDAIVRVAGRKT